MSRSPSKHSTQDESAVEAPLNMIDALCAAIEVLNLESAGRADDKGISASDSEIFAVGRPSCEAPCHGVGLTKFTAEHLLRFFRSASVFLVFRSPLA